MYLLYCTYNTMLLLTHKIGGIVGVAASFIYGFLRVGAQGTGKGDTLAGHVVDVMRCKNSVGRNVLLHPIDERSERVEHICARPAFAMIRAGHHEEPVKVAGLLPLGRTA